MKTMTADGLTPVGCYKALVKNNEAGFLLESVDQSGRFSRYSFVGHNSVMRLKKKDLIATLFNQDQIVKREESFFSLLNDILKNYKAPKNPDFPPFVAGLVGYIGYDMIREIEKLPNINKDDLNLPDALLEIYSDYVVFDHFKDVINLIHVVFLNTDEDLYSQYAKAVDFLDSMVQELKSYKEVSLNEIDNNASLSAEFAYLANMTKEQFIKNVEIAKNYIYEGDIFQVVLSQRFDFSLDVDSFDVYRALRLVNPSPYLYYLSFPEVKIVGSSPEPMIKVEDSRVISRPIAGTRPRGKNDWEDKELSKELLNDPKERAEHVMLVDLARNDVGKVCEYKTERVDEFMTVEYYSHVIHLTSQVSGTLKEEKNVVDVLKAALPAGTVSGAPKVRAMQIIDELEPTKRGIYAGVVGYIDFQGNLDTAIAIRTLVVTPDQIGHLQAGCGIVADSNPEKEYQETLHKAKAVLTSVNLARCWANEGN